MTRINAGIPPKVLSNKHLLAEHREIKRVPNNIVKRLKQYKQINQTTDLFCLGTGHINFFNNKISFLYNRYKSLYNECIRRGFKVTDYSAAFESAIAWAPQLNNDWRPKLKDIKLIITRLLEKDYENYKSLSAYKIWKEQLAADVEELKQQDPQLYNHIKNIK